VLAKDQRRRAADPRQPHRQLAAEPVGHVVPPGRHVAQGQVRQIRVLGPQQVADQPLIDVDIGGRNAARLDGVIIGHHGRKLPSR